MPFIESSIHTHYQIDGPTDGPWLIFSNSLGTNLSMWNPQVRAISSKCRILRYDTRGHGRTLAENGPVSLDQLGHDVLELMDALAIERAAFCGLSMGGLVGMWLAINAGSRIKRLVLCNTAAKIATTETWNARIAQVQQHGIASIAAAVIQRWFTPEFSTARPQEVEELRRMLLNSPAEGYTSCCAAIRDADLREVIGQIETPTLIVSGSRDPVTPPRDHRFLAERIKPAEYFEVPAAHLSNIEAHDLFDAGLMRFLSL